MSETGKVLGSAADLAKHAELKARKRWHWSVLKSRGLWLSDRRYDRGMTVLRGSKTWKRHDERPFKATLRPCELTVAEENNVRALVVKLRAEYPSWPALAMALGVQRVTLAMMRSRARRPTAGLALRLSRLLGVSIEDVLAGRGCNHGADLRRVER